jgi:serine/threonine protein kinase
LRVASSFLPTFLNLFCHFKWQGNFQNFIQVMINQTISHYKILRKLGEGGMGEVYLAEDTELHRQVALKFLSPHLAANADFKTRFKREARAAAALNHPNIITIHEVAEYENRSYIVMEYVEGESLKKLLAEKELSIGKVTAVTIQICEGMSKAHQAGIVHRDLKPDNILVDQDGWVKILDFGLAKLKAAATQLTKADTTMGTIYYMSPEQAQGVEVDQRSDLFSLGVILYELLARQLPFKGEYEAAILYSLVHEEPEPLARYKTGVPEGLQRIVDKALQKEPSTRYQSAAEVLADLKGLQKETMIGAVARPSKRRINSRSVAYAASGLLMVIIAGYAIFSLREKRPAVTHDEQQRNEEMPAEKLPIAESIRIEGISAEVENALRLAYSAERQEAAPAAAAAIMVQRGVKATAPWRPLVEGETMSSADKYRIVFQPEEAAYFYIFQIDNTGKLDWLFPRNSSSPYSMGANPVPAGVWTELPDGGTTFYLDENLGVEHIYIVATHSRWNDLEAALAKASKSRAAKASIQYAFNLQTRGVGGTRLIDSPPSPRTETSPTNVRQLIKGQAGVLVIERWFQHVSPR